MRYIDRKGETAPNCLSSLDKATQLDERTRAIQYYKTHLARAAGGRVRSFGFKAYSHDDVRAAIERLFDNKCAYCDNRYDAVHPVEIEHWRPKAEVKIAGQKKNEWHHGYYWLASDWDNLLPACIDCNRERYQRDFVTGERTLLGKKNWFPVINEAARWRDPDQDCEEEPLLLNPCVDKAREYLKVTDEGVIEIRPKLPAKRSRARASIKHYALNRKGLVSARRGTIITIQKTMATIRTYLKIFNSAIAIGRSTDVIGEALETEFAFLESLAAPNQPFSFVTEEMIGKFRRELEAL